MKVVFLVIIPLILIFPAYSQEIDLSSFGLTDGQIIPVEFTCDGDNISPPLSWNTSLEGIVSYVIVLIDIDAPVGNWVHWIIFDIPGDHKSLESAINSEKITGSGIRQGINDWGRIGYGGPCPPQNREHRYNFRIYALDSFLRLDSPSLAEIMDAIKDHIMGKGEMILKYKR